MSRIRQMVERPGDYRFRAWQTLKVPKGRDRYSSMRLTKLRETYPEVAEHRQQPDLDEATVLRWYGRAREACPEHAAAALVEFAEHVTGVKSEVGRSAAGVHVAIQAMEPYT